MNPHDNWARFYDFVYENTYGNFYNNFNNLTVKAIRNIRKDGIILDYGAGTGRLSFPLAQNGYKVIAVEQSEGMVGVIKQKLENFQGDIDIHNCSIADYKNGKADLALAIFTVLSYVITEEELNNSIKSIVEHLNPRGYFFFDLPQMVFFNHNPLLDIHKPNLNRLVELNPTSVNNVYLYHETCSGIFNGEEFNYHDEFNIRYWNMNLVNEILVNNGCIDTNIGFPQFNQTGATYKLYQKI